MHPEIYDDWHPVTMEAEGWMDIAGRLWDSGDFAGARDAYESAASEGSAEAMHMLGIIYRDGCRGIVPDIDQSRRWFASAAKEGYEPSRKALASLNARSEYITVFSPNGYEGNFGGEMSRFRRR